ncbi:glycosyltransferase involved in cell wall biosynthesis [Microbacterium sp. W4I4]|uniref:glycosyltransferase n=1 Tax=Microbacterium sp. W4I4 TaxID=3042295 RepID=UPI00277F5CAC|nr:glycosyltransferase [Microbacterium sp. W4I4]MDQ0613769.1 glycosyltransferase involved in cell wall biosynthesis [Microbacterium sp. W4I4]
MQGTLGIVIPVWNTEGEFLDECIASVRAQTLECVVVIVDDGSTNPSTLDALARFEQQGLRVIRHPENRGTSRALDTGAAALDTDYLMPLGSDDRILPTFAANVVRELDSDPEAGIVSVDLRFFGRATGVQRLPEVNGVADLLFGNIIPGASAFRRSDWVALNGFAPGLRLGQDWEFWVRLLATGKKAHVVHEPLYEYRRHSGQATARTPYGDRIALSLDVVRMNADIWGAHVEEIMARYWKVDAERQSQADRLEVLERRYGAVNRLLGRMARLARPSRRSS